MVKLNVSNVCVHHVCVCASGGWVGRRGGGSFCRVYLKRSSDTFHPVLIMSQGIQGILSYNVENSTSLSQVCNDQYITTGRRVTDGEFDIGCWEISVTITRKHSFRLFLLGC